MKEDDAKRIAATCIGELPPGDWDWRVFNETLIFACPEHQPYIFDGELKPLTFGPEDFQRVAFWEDRGFTSAAR